MNKTRDDVMAECAALTWHRASEYAALLGGFVSSPEARNLFFEVNNSSVNAAEECLSVIDPTMANDALFNDYFAEKSKITAEIGEVFRSFNDSYSSERKKIVSTVWGQMCEYIHSAMMLCHSATVDGYASEVAIIVNDIRSRFGSDLVRVTVRRKAR